jgi:hypothetical protein
MAIGDMRQSTYVEEPLDSDATLGQGRYKNVVLERVDGVWPPHREYEPSRLRTLEDRLRIKTGQSYFMPNNAIHDVEVVRSIAARTPAITLFLAAECSEIPKTYMVPTMAEYHRDQPDPRDDAKPRSPREWDASLGATANYLRGDTEHLRIEEIVACTSTYGFMNV